MSSTAKIFFSLSLPKQPHSHRRSPKAQRDALKRAAMSPASPLFDIKRQWESPPVSQSRKPSHSTFPTTSTEIPHV